MNLPRLRCSDAGAYYYHNPSPFNNYQEALLAVKADAEARQIPFRYSQWHVVDCNHMHLVTS